MSHFGLLMAAIKKAVRLARSGEQPIVPDVQHPPIGYNLHPNEYEAGDYLSHVLRGEFKYLAYDIETAYSVDEDSAEEHEGDIRSIQFSTAPHSGIFLPWRGSFISVAKAILASPAAKMGWNNWRFDDPVLRANGCTINGVNHDLMWAWHQLQPDLPRGLQFAAGQLGWPWPWKHLGEASPEFYGIVDVDVLQSLV